MRRGGEGERLRGWNTAETTGRDRSSARAIRSFFVHISVRRARARRRLSYLLSRFVAVIDGGLDVRGDAAHLFASEAEVQRGVFAARGERAREVCRFLAHADGLRERVGERDARVVRDGGQILGEGVVAAREAGVGDEGLDGARRLERGFSAWVGRGAAVCEARGAEGGGRASSSRGFPCFSRGEQGRCTRMRRSLGASWTSRARNWSGKNCRGIEKPAAGDMDTPER